MTETTIDDFTRAATEFLDANAERRSETKFVWGEGSDSVSMLDEKTPEQEQAEVAEGKAWKQKEFDAGFGWISGPAEYGGRGLPGAYDRAYREIVGQYAIPSQSPFGIGLGMVAPTILAHAIPEVRERYLRPLWRGEIIGCQLFSEPIAGSDLAGIQTKAERDGDEWIITGQKVWTSGAQYSDIGEIITRTSPDKPKHKGLSMFLVDMHAPGVEVRPLRQMTGGASFNEVFFEEVRVHDSHRLGDVDEGWTVALTTLMNERAAIGGGGAGVGSMSMTRFVEMARHFGLSQDPLIRQGLAEAYIRTSVARYTNMRAMAKIRAGQLPGPEMSIGKLALTQNMMKVGQLIGEILGPRLVADTGEWGTYAFSEMVLGTPGMRVAGGTDEVMRNIVGERVLGLPKEPRTS
jgi:alkylation response protein AidB-like acyl-CoA dehydrogenase